MTCRACGATIAAKAIVCYKCGIPTQDGPEVARRAAGSPWLRQVLLMCAWVVAVVGLSLWLIPQTPEGTWMRWVAWAGVPVVIVLGLWLIGGPHSSRLRRR